MADKSHDKHWQRAIKVTFQKEPQRRQMQKVKKQLKPNRQPKPARRKDWLDSDDLDFEPSERVMPRGERERRRTLLATALADKAAEEDGFMENPPPVEIPDLHGTVVEVSSGLCRVDLGGRILMCRLRGSLTAEDTGYTNVIAVGDEVIVLDDASPRGVVEQVLPRRSVLARPDVFYSHLQQVIVANADQLLIVAAWRNPTLWPELVDRYLIAAERNKLTPIICVNKIDLAEDLLACQTALRPYQALGYQVIFASALTGAGIDTLGEILRGGTTALAGMSGVGKSSLLAAVQPGLQLRTGAVSESSGEGRHTTTQVTMLSLTGGGFVV
ncbi:MAG: ribosome small subunit-dependent GTPase A, partial [Chloroflexi bacterium]|nr:ribosome small subunit-dependent GTPase A [Chloroflexota bacterium]